MDCNTIEAEFFAIEQYLMSFGADFTIPDFILDLFEGGAEHGGV